MLLTRRVKLTAFVIAAASMVAVLCPCCRAQAALLLEEPYGFFGIVNPTGHTAIYFTRICAETPTTLRRCGPGESGSVIARYQGIDGYDWVAMPLIPYLYSVESITEVPAHVDRAQVRRLRDHYRETHLQSLGPHVFEGNLVHGGWTQLVGAAYERRVYAFRFDTTPEQDDALIAAMNAKENRSQFNLLYNNCADFARGILNSYFPRTFNRAIFPDAWMTTPKQITYKLTRYARKHPDLQLTIYEIPQVPGYRRQSHSNKTIAESLTTTGYAVPIALVNPYLAVGLSIDYLMRGRFHFVPERPKVLEPGTLSALTAPTPTLENAPSASEQAHNVAAGAAMEALAPPPAKSGLPEIRTLNE
jgi:hypothetical protein